MFCEYLKKMETQDNFQNVFVPGGHLQKERTSKFFPFREDASSPEVQLTGKSTGTR